MLQPMENGPEPSPEATIKVDREEAIFNAARTLPVGDRAASERSLRIRCCAA